MYVTAAMLAAELKVAPRTIADHVRAMERSGQYPGIRAKIGRPKQINRELFMRYQYGPDWRAQIGEQEGEE